VLDRRHAGTETFSNSFYAQPSSQPNTAVIRLSPNRPVRALMTVSNTPDQWSRGA